MERLILFFGAGASRRFGLPTSDQLLENAKRRFPSYRRRISSILSDAQQAKFSPNLETLLRVLDSSENPRRAIEYMGPYVSAVASPARISKLRPHPDDAILAKMIKDYILRRYYVRTANRTQIIKSVYDDFFRKLKTRFNLPSLSKSHRQYPSIDIFTTNFDNVVEIFGKLTEVPIYNGYSLSRGKWRFNHRKFVDGSKRDAIRIYKIHGTVTHAVNTVGKIREVERLPRRGSLYIDKLPALPQLTYPGAHQYFSEEPRLELLYLLKRKLNWATKCLVIGYSFADPNIVQVFADSLTSRLNLRIGIISPHATSKIGDTRYKSERVKPFPNPIEDINIPSLDWP